MLGGLVHTIEEIGKDQEDYLKQQGHANIFPSIQEVHK
jgi:hypothetical protein